MSIPVTRAPHSLAPRASSQSAARSSANHRIAWYGHAIVYALSCFLLFVVAGFFPALIVALAWGIGLASHGFFAVAAPVLRERWVRQAEGRAPTHGAPSLPAPAARQSLEQRSARSLEELSAAIAHEIRNPITAAKSLVQQLAEDPTAAENAEHARIAIDELDRVERSIAHLLRFAREEPFEPSEIQLSTVIDSALDLMRDRATKEHVRLVREIDAMPVITADGEQLRKVIVNLIGNALDAHAQHQTREPFVNVAAGQNLAGSEVWIRVRDNGPGMAPSVLAKAFQLFYSTKSHGTGLGLALARKIVERHGGTIAVTSNEGQGTELVLTLPRHRGTGASA
jgi:signal transduction histidine kinase